MRVLKRLERYGRNVGGDSDCCDCMRSRKRRLCHGMQNYEVGLYTKCGEGVEEDRKCSD